MTNILFIGDIVGRIGRETVIKFLPRIKKKYKINFVIANAENSAHGSGVTEKILKELIKSGVDFFTSGDHAFSNKKHLDIYDKYPIIRPANFSKNVPGKGWANIELKNNKNLLLINLIGRVFMSMDHDCPFAKLDEILAINNLSKRKNSAILIDIHAETTSEKVNIFYYADGRASAVLGTHTHIMTADARISPNGTAYITDVGMSGAADESLGIAKEGTLKTFLTQIKQPHVIPEKGRSMINAILIYLNEKNEAKQIKTICEFINIK